MRIRRVGSGGARRLAAAVVLVFGLSLSAEARAQVAGFSRTLPVAVTETSGVTLTGYQVLVTLDTAALVTSGRMKADGGDIRFATGCESPAGLPYWIESGVGTAQTKMWVRVPTLAANATLTLVMSYGNPAASTASDAFAVFDGDPANGGAPYSSTKQVTPNQTSSSASSQRGFRFTPKEDVLVVELGKYEPLGTAPRYVTLFDFTAQTKIEQELVTGAAATYAYEAVSGNPFFVRKDVPYVLALHQGVADGYYYGVSTQVADELTYEGLRYCNSCNQDQMPTATIANPQQHQGVPDFRFLRRKHAASEPAQSSGSCAETTTCDTDCSHPACGDGHVNALVAEVCDDGNAVDTDACRNDCTNATCGDGIVQAGVEQCDDGNRVDTDACRNDCSLPSCGDGVVDPGEACDDGNDVDTDACRVSCELARCGDGVVLAGVEQCDDGNAVSNDGCSATCVVDVDRPDTGFGDDQDFNPVTDDPLTVEGGGGCAFGLPRNRAKAGEDAALALLFGAAAVWLRRRGPRRS